MIQMGRIKTTCIVGICAVLLQIAIFAILYPTIGKAEKVEIVDIYEIVEIVKIVDIDEIVAIAHYREITEILQIAEIDRIIEIPEIVEIIEILEIPDIPDIPEPDRTQPIYEVWKHTKDCRKKSTPCTNPSHFVENATAELQWMVKDFADEHGYCEKILFSVITLEPTWNPRLINNVWYGLTQICKGTWISGSWSSGQVVRLIDDNFRKRDLLCAETNILTTMEIWNYAVDLYELDLTTDHGYHQLLYWHSSGKNPTNLRCSTQYTRLAFRFVSELVEVEAIEEEER